MSRITDSERGARIAWDMAFEREMQLELFAADLDPAFWRRVRIAAEQQLEEEHAMREARG